MEEEESVSERASEREKINENKVFSCDVRANMRVSERASGVNLE